MSGKTDKPDRDAWAQGYAAALNDLLDDEVIASASETYRRCEGGVDEPMRAALHAASHALTVRSQLVRSGEKAPDLTSYGTPGGTTDEDLEDWAARTNQLEDFTRAQDRDPSWPEEGHDDQ